MEKNLTHTVFCQPKQIAYFCIRKIKLLKIANMAKEYKVYSEELQKTI